MELQLVPCEPVDTTAAGRRILDAAERLFYEHGITATGVDRVVDEAQTTKRTLYQRFGSKDALVAAYLQRRAHAWQAELARTVGGEPAECLDGVYDLATRWAREGRRGCAFVNAWAEARAGQGRSEEIIRGEKAWMRDLFTQIAQGDGSVGTVLHLLYEGAQIVAAIEGDLGALGAARDASRRLLAERA